MRVVSIAIVVLTQALFTTGDVLARTRLRAGHGFSLSALVAPWFLAYFTVRQVAMIGQLYILASIDLGRSASLFALTSLLIATSIGVLFLNEPLSATGYLGVALAISAFAVLAVDIRG